VDERRLVLCHYPFRTWNGIGGGAVNIHGHSHGRLTPATRQYDVGVDVGISGPCRSPTVLARRKRAAIGDGRQRKSRAPSGGSGRSTGPLPVALPSEYRG
jgi:hypothetical protein